MSRLVPAVLLSLVLAGTVGVAEAARGGEDTTSDEILAAAGIDEPPLLDPPDAETAKTRGKEIARSLRCPVCQALSVADSNSDTARAMYVRIEGFVAAGYTDEQIVDYFTDTYGEWVRLDPEKSGINSVLWFMPIVVLVVGGLVIAARSRPTVAQPVTAEPVAPAADDEYRQRILAELGEAPEPPVGPPSTGEQTS